MFWDSQEVPTKLEAPPDGTFGPQMLHSIAEGDAWGPCGVWDQTPVTYMQGMCLSSFTSFLAPHSFLLLSSPLSSSAIWGIGFLELPLSLGFNLIFLLFGSEATPSGSSGTNSGQQYFQN